MGKHPRGLYNVMIGYWGNSSGLDACERLRDETVLATDAQAAIKLVKISTVADEFVSEVRLIGRED